MRLVALDPTLTRGLNFDYMNQVLAWQTLQDVLTTLRPIVAANAPFVTSLLAHGRARAAGTCRWLSSLFASTSGEDRTGLDAQCAHARTLPGAADGETRGTPPAAVADACPLCGTQPICSPHVARCAHAFCYVCLRSAQALARAAPPSCPRCSTVLVGCERLRPALLSGDGGGGGGGGSVPAS